VTATGLDAADLAADLWRALDRAHLRPQHRAVVRDVDGRPAALWPVTQVLHAAVLVHEFGVPGVPVAAIGRSLARYDTVRGWTATPRPHVRRLVFHDDNAWLGLAVTQAVVMTGDQGLATQARRALDVAARGEDPAGGIRWHERARSRHACTSGPTALLALRLAEATRRPVDGPAAGLVDRQLRFLDTVLRRPDGLVADRVDARGRLRPEVWSYNQGAALGAHRLAAERLGRTDSVRRVDELWAAIHRHYTPDRLWREPPAFVAVLLRQLMARDAVTGRDDAGPLVDGWLAQVRDQGRDPVTGLVGEGGIGHYGDSRVIDQAAAAQVATLRALRPARRLLAC
jgi:hypothetical protein